MSAIAQYWSSTSHRALLTVAGIFLLFALGLYWQSFYFDYVYFDDSRYVLENPEVNRGLSLEAVRWAFTSTFMSNWHPLTWMSHMLDVSLFGVDPAWGHLHNLLLHWLNSLLVYLLLCRLTAARLASFFAALVFLVHPLHVESVAWIAERKDLLYSFFYLCALLVYDSYCTRRSAGRYLAILMLYLFALMAKPMAVTLPALLVVLDVFHYQKPAAEWEFEWRAFVVCGVRSVVHKLPLFLLSLVLSVVALYSQREGGALMTLDFVPLAQRMENAIYGYLVYLRQFALPIGLGPFYPLRQAQPVLYLFLPGLFFLLWVVASFRLLRVRPLLMLGLCWYLLTLLPVIGLIQVGPQIHADRYMYLPSLGVLLALVCLLPPGTRHLRALPRLLMGLFVIYLSAISFWQVSYWQNKQVLFNRALQLAGSVWRGHLELAQARAGDGPIDYGAIATPANLRALGDLAMMVGDKVVALEFYAPVVNGPHPSAAVLNNYALALYALGDFQGARKMLVRALELEPGTPDYRQNYQRLFPGESFPQP